MEKKYVCPKRKTVIVALLVLAIMVSTSGCGREAAKGESLILWYGQSELKDYLENAAIQYKRETGITVTCVYHDSQNYMEDIYFRSLEEKKDAPDVYLLRHDRLEQACMQGLAAANVSEIYSEKQYCETALESAAFQGKLMAYPFYFNTACMIYNTNYFAKAPATMGAITAFSETAEIGENVQNILYWDINDYFCNYPFIGAYLNIEANQASGEKGTSDENKKSQMAVTPVADEKTAECLQRFQNLGQYFAIDSESIRKEDVPAALMEERTLCILADSDMVHIVNWYASNYGVEIPYEISRIPDVSDELESCEGSYTELAVVNGMSLKQDLAADFAEFVTSDYVHNLYWLAGHFPAKAGMEYENEELYKLYEIYEQSQQFPQLLETEDLGVLLEVLFAKVWDGADIGNLLQSFTEKLEVRMNESGF